MCWIESRIAELQTIFHEKSPPSSYREEFSPSISLHKADREIMFSFYRTDRSFCYCRLPNDGQKMMQCSKCKEWYHINLTVKIPGTVVIVKKINYLEQDNHYQATLTLTYVKALY